MDGGDQRQSVIIDRIALVVLQIEIEGVAKAVIGLIYFLIARGIFGLPNGRACPARSARSWRYRSSDGLAAGSVRAPGEERPLPPSERRGAGCVWFRRGREYPVQHFAAPRCRYGQSRAVRAAARCRRWNGDALHGMCASS